MNYRQLQAVLKNARYNGSVLTVKLNAKKEVLQAEFDRLYPAVENYVPAVEENGKIRVFLDKFGSKKEDIGYNPSAWICSSKEVALMRATDSVRMSALIIGASHKAQKPLALKIVNGTVLLP